ncbi:hypothetical protein WICMUC_005470, partial [Wickerhamomyces mucosus]
PEYKEKDDLSEKTAFLDNSQYKHALYAKLGHAHVLTEDASLPDVEYLYEKATEMSTDDGLRILTNVLDDHEGDPNFPEEDYKEIE